MKDNWVEDNQNTQVDNDETFVDNTQQENNDEQKNKRKRIGKTRAPCWNFFEKIEVKGIRHGKCHWCNSIIKADENTSATSNLNKHVLRCKENPDKKNDQTTLKFKKEPNGEGSVSTWKHDEKKIKKAMTNLFVVGGLPFKFVENEAFIEFTNALNGKVVVPSRTKISKDVSIFYLEERNKLVTFLGNPNNTVHLTTDTWTSACQRVNYMVLTAHFIDHNWVMHKRIINFKPLDSHRGEDIGQEIHKCIQAWEIKNVMTCTVDNASSNDKVIDFLKKKLPYLYDMGNHFHIRCMAHILNLVVKDGMNENFSSVKCLQKAVRYIRNSTQWIARFKSCMKDKGVESNKFLCNDCPTRWNSTYELLKIAVDLEEVFYKYELEDPSFSRDVIAPVHEDFLVCKGMVSFFEKFKIKTDIVSTTTKPLPHMFFAEICDVYQHIRVWAAKPQFCLMGKEMKNKYDKYWGNIEKLNDYMYFAVILDPRMKIEFLLDSFEKMIKYKVTENNPLTGSEITLMAKALIRDIKKRLVNFFDGYKEKFDKTESNVSSQTRSNQDGVHVDADNDFLGQFFVQSENPSASKETELTRYLEESRIQYFKDFDILDWWKNNAPRYPIVSRMAKDVLGIQISTVASESAFSTSGRILDPYRTNLSAPIVEALVCTQDWVRKSKKLISDNIEDVFNDDDVAQELEDAIRKRNGNGKMPIDIE